MGDPARQIAIVLTPEELDARIDARARQMVAERLAEMAEERRPLTTAEACAALRITEPMIRRYRREGMPCFTAGKGFRYYMPRVRAWLEERGERGGEVA